MPEHTMKYTKETLQITGKGRQDCSDMHSFGPLARPLYIIHYVIKGSGYLEYDRKRFFVKTGESFLICPYTTYYYYPNPSDPWEYTWVDFRGQNAEAYVEASIMTKEQPVCPAIPAEHILPIYERLLSINIYSGNRREAGGLLLALLGIYADYYPSPCNHPKKEADSRLTAAVLSIQANYHLTHFNIEELCEMIPCNRVTLYRLFQNEFHQSPSEYLTAYRIRQACKLLDRGILVKTTAFSCGFADPFYFSRVFKQHMGMSPSEYGGQGR